VPFHWSEVNYLAVLVSGLVAFFVGGLWYQALFGKLWVKLHGYSPEKVKEMQASMSPPKFFGGMIASYLVLGFAVALLLTGLTEKTAIAGAGLGLLVWVAAAAVMMTNHIASDKVLGIYLIDAGCMLAYLLLMGLMLGAWR
jgi:Protein of unknown function (DUF1761)